jgi:hypothetical protein
MSDTAPSTATSPWARTFRLLAVWRAAQSKVLDESAFAVPIDSMDANVLHEVHQIVAGTIR